MPTPIRPRSWLAAAGCTALLLAGCATPTPYQPIGATSAAGGYSNLRIAPNRYRVAFAGNSLTSRERVETYLLYRAAELTVEQGFDSFSIVDRATDRNVETRVYRDPFYRSHYPFWRPWWRFRGSWGWRRWDPWFGDPFWPDQVDVRTIQRFEANAEIVLHRGRGPGGDRTFDAREVLTNLGPTIRLPGEEG